MYELERLKCKSCGMKISWVSQDPKRNYPPALSKEQCRLCFDKHLAEAGQPQTNPDQSLAFTNVIDTTDPAWRRANLESGYR